MPLTLADFIDETPGVTLDDIPDEEEDRINQTLEDLTQGLGEEPSGGPVSADVLVSKTLNDRSGFETIQDALDGENPVNDASGAEAGDTIRIESGEFNEVVSVVKENISLVGAGEDQTTIAGQIDVTATGFTLQGTTVRADVGVTDDTAVLIDDGTGATIENNTIVAREGGLALRVKQAPSSGVTAIETNTFQSLGNETAESLVVIGSNGSGSAASIVMTDGGEPMSLETQSNQPQVSDQPSVQVADNAFIGNISGQGAVVVEGESDIEVAVEQNDFSEALLFDDEADLVSKQSTAATVTTSGNVEPEPVSQGEGIEIPGDGDVRTADITADGDLPGLTAQDIAASLNPQQDPSQSEEADGFLNESEDESNPQTIQVQNTQFRGDDRSCGVFQFTPTVGNLAVPVTIGDGAILSTGKVNDVVGPNDRPDNQTETSGGSDSDLEDLPTIENNTFDRASLEFDLAVPSDVTEISFRYVFGSEEYNEFTGSGFNDVFAFFVNGDNVATVPDPNDPNKRIPASINNVNHGEEGVTQETNPQLFINNDPHDGDLVTVDPQNPPGPGIGFDPNDITTGGEPFPFEMDGFTVPLEITAPVDPGETNSIKIAIADVGDAIYDSWVIVAAADITATTGSDTA